VSFWFYSLYTLAFGFLIARSGALFARARRPGLLILILVLFGLFYDNLILALGRWLPAGPLLYALSLPRFGLHQIVLPWIIVSAFLQARATGIRWAQSRRALWIACLAAGLVMLLGVVTRLLPMRLEPALMDGVTRYVATGVSGPPLVSLLSIGFTGVVGYFLWRRAGWFWTLLFVVLTFVFEGLPVEALRRLVGSGVELALMLSLLAYERRLSGEPSAALPVA
jgi:hypothetical protein